MSAGAGALRLPEAPGGAPPRVVLVAAGAAFSLAVLRGLLQRGAPLAEVIAYSHRPSRPSGEPGGRALPVAPPFDVAGCARAAGVAARQVDRAALHDPEALLGAPPDVALVACLPARIPPPLLAVPRVAWLNLHPSPLPAFRGPTPLFWQLRAGARESAVTLHAMSERMDAGPVVACETWPLPAGAALSEIEAGLAAAGAALAADALAKLARGEALSLREQDESRASRQPAPAAGDFAIDPAWSVERAFRFVRGLREWRVPFPVAGTGRRLAIRDALAPCPGETPAAPWRVARDVLEIRLADGVLRVARRDVVTG